MTVLRVADLPPYARFIASSAGTWRCLFINLLLRVLVKWTMGLGIDVPRLRARQLALDRRARLCEGVTRSAACCDGFVAGWLTLAAGGASRVLLYLHGGAFVARSPAMHEAMVATWCKKLGDRALMVDYRLAPEHPYPAALDDCHAAYRWLLEQGYDPGQVVVAGDSAGGNLALALLQRIKSADEPMPACAVLLSPFVDFTLSGTSAFTNARRDPIFTPAFALAIRSLYAPAERFLDVTVSPLFGDFHGLPPLLLQVGSTEMLLDDAIGTAERAHVANVPVTLEIWDRLPHVFQAMSILPQALQAAEHVAAFIRQHTWREEGHFPSTRQRERETYAHSRSLQT